MKVHFFSEYYLLCIGDLSWVPYPECLRFHIIRQMSVKTRTKAIMIVGWDINLPKENA